MIYKKDREKQILEREEQRKFSKLNEMSAISAIMKAEKRGFELGKKEVAKKLLKLGLDKEIIIELTELTKENIEMLNYES